jgi:hypothetical protein
MAVFDRLNIRVLAAGAGLCGVALVLSPHVAAAPPTGPCVPAKEADVCSPPSAPVTDMAGIPMALPGPVPAAPVVPVVPAAPPLAPPVVPVAPVALAGAPVPGAPPPIPPIPPTGKGDPVRPPAPGAPAPGQPILPGAS